jgi:ATP-binding cassette, subfamily B, bacterial PglK
MNKSLKAVFGFLDKRHRIFFFLMIIASLFDAFLELLGVSIIIPIINLISNPNDFSSKWYLALLYEMSPVKSSSDFLIFVVSITIALYCFKALYSIAITAMSNRYANSFGARVGSHLFSIFLKMPYEYHKEHSSAEIMQKCSWAVSSVTASMSSILTITEDSIVGLLILGFLFYQNVIVATVVFGSLTVISILVSVICRRKLVQNGKRMAELGKEGYQINRESFENIKEAKTYHLENFYGSQYADRSYSIAKRQTFYTVLASLPKILIEASGMIAMLLAILIVLLEGATNTAIFTTFSVFAIAITRLLPYVSAISAHISNLNHFSSGVQSALDISSLEKQEESLEAQGETPFTFEREIRFTNVNFQYKDDERKILDQASMTLQKGKTIAFCGPSGMGKTTTIDLLLGLLKPTSGLISCDGRNISEDPLGWRGLVSYVPQLVFLTDGTIKENVALGFDPKTIDEERMAQAIKAAELEDFVQSLPQGINSSVGEAGSRLSGGQRQRIGIARAFYRNRPILIFDEATASLDSETEQKILVALKKNKKDKTIVVITHRLSTIVNFDEIYMVQNQKITPRSKEDILKLLDPNIAA